MIIPVSSLLDSKLLNPETVVSVPASDLNRGISVQFQGPGLILLQLRHLSRDTLTWSPSLLSSFESCHRWPMPLTTKARILGPHGPEEASSLSHVTGVCIPEPEAAVCRVQMKLGSAAWGVHLCTSRLLMMWDKVQMARKRGAGYRPGTGGCSAQVMDSSTEPQGAQEFYSRNWTFRLF